MGEEVYEVVAQAARYWFLFLMALIVWRSYRWFARDRKQRKKRLKLLPDAGYVGEMVVLRGSDELPVGTELPIASEGVLGSVRSADLYVPVEGVSKKQLWFEFDEEQGLYVEPFGKQHIEVDGECLIGRRKHTYMAHGSRLIVGQATLRLRLFAGFEQAGEAAARVLEDEPEQPPTAQPAVPMLTPQQLQALWMQQAQWMAMMQQAQQQSTATQADAPPAPAMPSVADAPADIPAGDLTAAYRRPAAEPTAAAPEIEPAIDEAAEAEADAFYERNAHAQQEFNDELFDTRTEELTGDNPTFAPRTTFYPPVLDDDAPADDPFAPYDAVDPADDPFAPYDAPAEGRHRRTEREPDDAWDYAPYPQSDATFADEGYTYPVYVEEPDKSLYVEPDEAERAKQLVWDKYLKGGRRG